MVMSFFSIFFVSNRFASPSNTLASFTLRLELAITARFSFAAALSCPCLRPQRNASFTDYLVPTALDMPPVEIAALIEQPEPGAPFGAKGIGEPPSISSTAAVVAAIRAATELNLTHVPVRPTDIALAGA